MAWMSGFPMSPSTWLLRSLCLFWLLTALPPLQDDVGAAGVEVVEAAVAVENCLTAQDGTQRGDEVKRAECSTPKKEEGEEVEEAQKLLRSSHGDSDVLFLASEDEADNRVRQASVKTKENQSDATSMPSPARNASEVVLENVERVVISVVKRDTVRVSDEGGVSRHRSLSGAYFHDSHTRRVRHRRHKEAQMNTSVGRSHHPSVDKDNALPTEVKYQWEERGGTTEEAFNHEDRVMKGGRRASDIPGATAGHKVQIQGEEAASLPKFLVRRITKPKFHRKNIPSETFARKMNFKGYFAEQKTGDEDKEEEIEHAGEQVVVEEEGEEAVDMVEEEDLWQTSLASYLSMKDDNNDVPNDLTAAEREELTNLVEAPVTSIFPPTQVMSPPTNAPTPTSSITTTTATILSTTSATPTTSTTTTTPPPNTTTTMTATTTSTITTTSVPHNGNVRANENQEGEEDEGKEKKEKAGGAEEQGESKKQSDHQQRNGTEPAYIPSKLPFGPFLPSLDRPQRPPPGLLRGFIGKFQPFLLTGEEAAASKPNSGDLMVNMLSPLVGTFPKRTKAKGRKVFGFDHERSHKEELYNQVSGGFLPELDSRGVGRLPASYPSFPLLRHNKQQMFLHNKIHGGFAFIDQRHDGSLTRNEAPQAEDSPRAQNLVVFGPVEEDAIMENMRSCTRHIKLQLTDHYSLDDLVKEATNPLRQLVIYVNLKSINYEGYGLVLERIRHLLDYLSVVQGGLTLYSVIPTQEDAINTTRSAEVKTHLITLSDSVLDHCARLYPTCYREYSLTSLTSRLQQTYDKDSGFDIYRVEGAERSGCSSNEVCGTEGPPSDVGPLQTDPQEQLREFGRALCRSSYHVMIELEANLPTYDFEDENRFWENAREESMRVRAQTGLVLHDILPRELKKYDKNRPPKYEGQATIVYFHVTVLSVDSINEESMTYVADIFLAQSWRDHRLRLPENMTEEYRILDVEWLHNIWRPDCFFKNAKKVTFHEMSVPNHYLWLYHDKTLLYMAKLTLVLSCAMKFEAYPHDTQICSMMIESLSHTTHDLVFKWNETDPLVVNPDIELPQLDISRNYTDDCTLTYSTGNFTCLAVVFNLRRRLGYHLFHTYVPSAITVVMSWISFWIKPEAIPARVTLGVTSLLTLATQNQQSQSSLPPVSYIKAIDVWMSSCTVFVFASLLQFGLVNYFMDAEPLSKDMTGYSVEDLTDLDEKKSEDGRLNGYSRTRSRSRSRMRSHSPGVPQYVVHRCTGKDIALYIDKFSRGFFPFAFFVLNISYWTTYGTM